MQYRITDDDVLKFGNKKKKKKSRNTCSHSVYVQKLDKGLNTRLNHLSRHSILVRCKQSLPSVYTLGLCAFEIISHSWNTSLSQYGWENWLFPFLPCNPSLSSLIFTPDSVWLWERERERETEWKRNRERWCVVPTPPCPWPTPTNPQL